MAVAQESGLQKRQGTWSRLLASAPLFLTFLYYLYPLNSSDRYLPLSSRETLGLAMQVEWTAWLAGVFLIGIIIFIPAGKTDRVFQAGWVALFIVVFGWITRESLGITASVYFIVLIFMTYGGTTLLQEKKLLRGKMIALTVLRWLVTALVLFPLNAWFDMPVQIESWDNDAHVIEFGAWFFGVLFLLELLFYPWLDQRLTSIMCKEMETQNINEAGDNINYLKRRAFYRRLRGIQDD